MGPKGPKRRINQATFDDAVKENMEEFEMDADEAVASAIEEFEMQGVDLTGIIKVAGAKMDGERAPARARGIESVGDGARRRRGRARSFPQTHIAHARTCIRPVHAIADDVARRGAEHPAVVAVRAMEAALSDGAGEGGSEDFLELLATHGEAVAAALDEDAAENGCIAAKFGAVEAVIASCGALKADAKRLPRALSSLCVLMRSHGDARSKFVPAGGAHVLCGLLSAHAASAPTAASVAGAIGTACTKSERNKLACVEAGADQLLVNMLEDHATHGAALAGACAGIRALCTGDGELNVDEIASKAFDNARKIAKLGAPKLLLEGTLAHAAAAGEDVAAVDAASACADALRAVSVNDEICSRVGGEMRGMASLIALLGEPAAQTNAALAKAVAGTLRALCAADDNKSRFSEHGGCETIVGIMRAHAAAVAVQEVSLGCLAAATLRNPEGAVAAVEAGGAGAAVDAAEAHPKSSGVSRQLCLFVRNAVCRTPETKAVVLETGVEAKLREAKERWPSKCGDVAHAALRDLGLET